MAANPRIVTADTVFRWDGAMQRLPRGQVIDVPVDSALERAIGKDRLIPLGAKAAQPEPAPVTEAAAEEEPQAAPKRTRAAMKDQAAAGDSSSTEAGS